MNRYKLFVFTIVSIVLLTACGAPSTPTMAETPESAVVTALPPAPTATPLPGYVYGDEDPIVMINEDVDLHNRHGYQSDVVVVARENCRILPFWLRNIDPIGIDYRILRQSLTKDDEDHVTVAYVLWPVVFINDRSVVFEPGHTEVYYLRPEGEPTFELDPAPYIERATQILNDQTDPVLIKATWEWSSEQLTDYIKLFWEVADVECQ